MQPHFLHSSSFLFDLGLRQYIHFCWLFSRNLLASISNKTWLKRDLVFEVVVIFKHYKNDWLKPEKTEKWSYIPDHPYRILIIEGSKSGKTNSLINLINEQNDIDKISLYAKDLSEPWYEYLITKCKNAGIKYFNDLNALIECSNTLDEVYENI